MWHQAPSMSAGGSPSRANRYFWRLQPTTDFHEEGRPLQLEDQAGATGTFAATTRRNALDLAGDVLGAAGTFAATTRRCLAALAGQVLGPPSGTFAATTRRNTMVFLGTSGPVVAVARKRILRLRNTLRAGR